MKRTLFELSTVHILMIYCPTTGENMAHKTWNLRQGDIIVVEPELGGDTNLIVIVRNSNNRDDMIAALGEVQQRLMIEA